MLVIDNLGSGEWGVGNRESLKKAEGRRQMAKPLPLGEGTIKKGIQTPP
jgi:hypothetical protein